MDQNNNNSQNEFLWALLDNPANDAHLYNYNLQRLVNDFPQSGILQALLAHSSDEKNLKQASVYFNARSLYKLINAPSSLTGVSDEKIIVQNNIPSAAYQHQTTDTYGGENYFSDHTAVETENEATLTTDSQPAAGNEFGKDVADEHHITEAGSGLLNTIPFEEPVENHVAEEHITAPVEITLETVIPESEVPHVEEPVADHTEETYERLTSQIKDEINNSPVAEPVINYAFGMGQRLPPDAEVADSIAAEPSSAEITQETAGTHDEIVEEAQSETPAEQPIENTAVEEPGVMPVATEQPVFIDDTVTSEYKEVTELEDHTYNEEPVSTNHITVEKNYVAEPEHKQEEIVDYTDETYPLEVDTESNQHNIDDETFEEITGIENIDVEPDVPGNIAATDFFTFDRAFGEHKESEAVNEPSTSTPTLEPVNEQADDTEQQDVSKYHDEKMPYSFLWWLDKTRKEHSGVYQPYIVPDKEEMPVNRSRPGTDELQQQYYENIFHITSVEELDKSVPVPPHAPSGFDPKSKEHVIIERFIQEEPQIKPQSSDKLDNENKAKKSSEDRDELVSETLAAIYSDQMLYHKAIASYKKLMLKFPEKSRYFAAKIEQLEKKTN
ncbi:hypothetical protein [Mucilaginibacter sp.]|uniref:hypothetical protein n=1 Tax=Mucilaginibacter sp. TaxID=1882438 RepID=UPI00263A0398|nr:hypothetical protein [Mucilaginibacter sp.]MDB4922364.1 hypothetical protein [Mucilaginibacter sp.]